MDRTPADRPDHPRAAERFNEEQATHAVRGADQPDIEQGVAAVREVLKTLPFAPGRLSDAGRAWRRALRWQGTDAQEPGHQLHAGYEASKAPAANGRADTLHDHRDDARPRRKRFFSKHN